MHEATLKEDWRKEDCIEDNKGTACYIWRLFFLAPAYAVVVVDVVISGVVVAAVADDIIALI